MIDLETIGDVLVYGPVASDPSLTSSLLTLLVAAPIIVIAMVGISRLWTSLRLG
jgi:hypothetical protein